MKLITLMINNQQDVPIDEMRILTSHFDFVIYKFSVQRLRFPVFDHGNHRCRCSRSISPPYIVEFPRKISREGGMAI